MGWRVDALMVHGITGSNPDIYVHTVQYSFRRELKVAFKLRRTILKHLKKHNIFLIAHDPSTELHKCIYCLNLAFPALSSS